MSDEVKFLRRRDLLEMGISKWKHKSLVKSGALRCYGFSGGRIVPWEQLTDSEKRRQKRLYRQSDVRV